MISELSSRVRPSNRLHNIIAIASLALGSILFGVGAVLPSYSGLVQSFAIIPFTLALYVFVRFSLSELYYDIILDSDERAILTVRQKSGNRYTTLIAVHLSSITDITREAENMPLPTGIPVHRFTPTVFARGLCRITCSGEERCIIRLECNDQFTDLLRRYVEESRALDAERSEDDE